MSPCDFYFLADTYYDNQCEDGQMFHLMSGAARGDETESLFDSRGEMAILMRTCASTPPVHLDLSFVGDFNMN